MANTPIRLLSTNGLSRHYGGVIALSEVTMAVHPGQIFSLIGPNGAGKNDPLQLRHRIGYPDTRHRRIFREIHHWAPTG